jgi:hypothetical protein
MEENVQGALALGIDRDDLEGGLMSAAFQGALIPFNAGPGIVFRVGEKIIPVISVVIIDGAGMTPAFSRAKIIPKFYSKRRYSGVSG